MFQKICWEEPEKQKTRSPPGAGIIPKQCPMERTEKDVIEKSGQLTGGIRAGLKNTSKLPWLDGSRLTALVLNRLILHLL
jgi:hypothetical protein